MSARSRSFRVPASEFTSEVPSEAFESLVDALAGLDAGLWVASSAPRPLVFAARMSTEELFARAGVSSREWARSGAVALEVLVGADEAISVRSDPPGSEPSVFVVYRPLAAPQAALLVAASQQRPGLEVGEVLSAPPSAAAAALGLCGLGGWSPALESEAPLRERLPDADAAAGVCPTFRELLAAGFVSLADTAAETAVGLSADWDRSPAELVDAARLASDHES